MQVRNPPRVYQLMVRIRKLTIFVTVPPTTTIASVKEEVLSALTSDINQNAGMTDTEVPIPKVETIEEFELSKPIRGKDRTASPSHYEMLESSTKLKDARMHGWEVLYIQLRSPSGDLLPVEATDPPIEDDEEMPVPPPPEAMESDVRKGKRKAED
ncbi:hypothetical protein E1B28_004823 [Marasmius oreades]|uniref:Uncharacterized protein n=1 Tax=Marasmius oreades TaxID=181124 RepID=A0A9P8AD76_9AGAR|nr:uncharacterized protein E1B28_004823 [Marasmius oreades]KAG7097481.1 hypothetical protein E1B28_004823 [Marasmius oreades]